MEFQKTNGVGPKGVTQLTIAAGFVVVKNDLVLLSKDRKDDFWKFTGGTVQDGESFRETAKRELKEETNLSATFKREPLLFTFHKEIEDKTSYYVLIHYIAENPRGEVRSNDDMIEELEWFDINNLPKNLAPNIKPIIEQLN